MTFATTFIQTNKQTNKHVTALHTNARQVFTVIRRRKLIYGATLTCRYTGLRQGTYTHIHTHTHTHTRTHTHTHTHTHVRTAHVWMIYTQGWAIHISFSFRPPRFSIFTASKFFISNRFFFHPFYSSFTSFPTSSFLIFFFILHAPLPLLHIHFPLSKTLISAPKRLSGRFLERNLNSGMYWWSCRKLRTNRTWTRWTMEGGTEGKEVNDRERKKQKQER